MLLAMGLKKENVKEKDQFMEDIKQPLVAGIMCTIDRGTFFMFTKKTWIRDSNMSCHIMNNATSLFDIIDINESIQGSSGNMMGSFI